VFARMMNDVEAHARQYNFLALSVCIFPEQFGKMYAILRTGWEERARRGDKVILTKV